MNVIRVLSGKSEGKKEGIKTPPNRLSHKEYLHKKSGYQAGRDKQEQSQGNTHEALR